MSRRRFPRAASSLPVGAFMVLAVLPAAEPAPIQPTAAAPQILTHAPWIEESGVPASAPDVRVVFGGALDPESVHEGTVRLGYRDVEDRYRLIPATVILEDDRSVLVRPREALWPAVYYEVQMLGGNDGVRALDGLPLAEDYRWRFSTQVEFRVEPELPAWVTQRDAPFRRASVPMDLARSPALRWQDCQKPDPAAVPSGGPVGLGGPAPVELVVHVYQSVCDAPVVPGKTAMIQVYAVWPSTITTGVSQTPTLERFEADLEFSNEYAPAGAPIRYTFHRPDTPAFRAGRRSGRNAARGFGWIPSPVGEGDASSSVKVTVTPTDAEDPLRFTPGRRAFDWARSKAEHDVITLHMFTFAFQGGLTQPWSQPSQAELKQMGEAWTEYIRQTFPVKDVVVNASHAPIRVPAFTNLRSETVADPPAPCAAGCPIRDTEVRWDMPVGSKSPSGTPSWDLVHRLMETERNLQLDQKPADVMVGVIPHEIFLGPNAQTGTAAARFGLGRQSVIMTPPTLLGSPMPAHLVAHELGHYYGLGHCGDASFCRCVACGPNNTCGTDGQRMCDQIEGYRLEQASGGGGANKSSQEGNAEHPAILEPIMWYSARNTSSNDMATVEQRFIHAEDYRSLLEVFTEWSPGWFEGVFGQQAAGRTPIDRVLGGASAVAFAARSPWGDERLPAGSMCQAESGGAFHLAAAVAAQDAPVLRVYGYVRRDGTEAVVNDVRTRSGTDVHDAGRGWEPEPLGGVALELFGADGSVVARVPVTIGAEVVEAFAGEAWVPFVMDLPGTPEGARVAVQGASGLLAERVRSASAPEVTLLSPTGGARVDAGTEIRWSGSDADGDELTYDVMMRPDPDAPWGLLAGGIAATSLSLVDVPIHAGQAPEIRVVASDGFNVSAPATVRVQVRRALDPPGTLPAPGDVSVATYVLPKAVFASELDPATVTAETVSLHDPSGASVPVAVSLDGTGRRIVLVPEEPLRSRSRYAARLSRRIADRWGNELGADHEWSFTTIDDDVPPWIEHHTPAPGALTVPHDADLRVVFSELLDPASAGTANFRVDDASGSPVAGTIEWEAESLSLVFSAAEPLAMRTRFTVTIEGVRDEAGNELSEPYSFSFTTAGQILPVSGPNGGDR